MVRRRRRCLVLSSLSCSVRHVVVPDRRRRRTGNRHRRRFGLRGDLTTAYFEQDSLVDAEHADLSGTVAGRSTRRSRRRRRCGQCGVHCAVTDRRGAPAGRRYRRR